GVPLLLLALLVELEQLAGAVLVFPGELDFGLAVELPVGGFDRQFVDPRRRHATSLALDCGSSVRDALFIFSNITTLGSALSSPIPQTGTNPLQRLRNLSAHATGRP